jgi:hypothetical protein
MLDSAKKRIELIECLLGAMALVDELKDTTTGYLIERALDQARSDQVGTME